MRTFSTLSDLLLVLILCLGFRLFFGLYSGQFFPDEIDAVAFCIELSFASGTPCEALKLSSSLMKGNKWNAFVLDLSFIGWNILSAATCGILGIFYVDPYKKSTDAALYEAIKYGTAKA